jgi:hypothetical protein
MQACHAQTRAFEAANPRACVCESQALQSTLRQLDCQLQTETWSQNKEYTATKKPRHSSNKNINPTEN